MPLTDMLEDVLFPAFDELLARCHELFIHLNTQTALNTDFPQRLCHRRVHTLQAEDIPFQCTVVLK